jgi:hypothetical protein
LGLAILYRLLSREPFGKLALSGNLCFQLVAAIKTVQLHTDTPGFGSIFGRDHANISLRGTTKGDSAQMTGTAAEQELSLHQTRLAPGVSFQVVLTRIAD